MLNHLTGRGWTDHFMFQIGTTNEEKKLSNVETYSAQLASKRTGRTNSEKSLYKSISTIPALLMVYIEVRNEHYSIVP